jgi:hypothetical protein
MVKQLVLNIQADQKIVKEKIANKKIKEEFTLTRLAIPQGQSKNQSLPFFCLPGKS